MACGRNAHAGRIIITDTGQKHSPRSQGKKEPNYDTKYSISHCVNDSRRGSFAERGPDAERRSHFEQGREPKATSQNQSRPQNCGRAAVSGRLELREGRMDSCRRLQVCEGPGHSHRRANSQKSTEAAFEGAFEFRENQARALSRPEQRRSQSGPERAEPQSAPRLANWHALVARSDEFPGSTESRPTNAREKSFRDGKKKLLQRRRP